MLNTDDFILRLEQIFTFYHLTPATFAEQIGVQRSSLSHLLSGRNRPSLDFIMKVEESYSEVDFYWLLQGKGVFPKSKNTNLTTQNEANKREQSSSESELLKAEKPQLHSSISETETAEKEIKSTTEIKTETELEAESKPLNQLFRDDKKPLNSNENKIREVIIFYENGTFEHYKPKN